MRILLVTPFVPHRKLGHGTATVASHFVDYFGARHDLSVVCFYSDPRELALVEELTRTCAYVKAIPFPAREWGKRQVARLRSLAGTRPLVVSLFDSHEMRAELRRLTEARPFDLVQMDCAFMGQYVDLFASDHCKKTLLEIDVHMKPLRRRYEQKSSPWGRALAGREWRQMQRYEPILCERFDRVYTVSEDDRALLQSMNPELGISLFRYGADPDLFSIPAKPSAGHEVLFVGSFMHRPNVGAALWFHQAVLPLILEEEPETRFQLVGSEPPAEIQKLADDPAVSVTGWVPSVGEHLENADVCVVPLQRGGGVKLKTLEMMAAGRAIVTTEVGCEGINVRSGSHLVVAHSASEFASAVVDLLRDPERRRSLGQRARELARREHSWPANLATVEREYEGLVAGSTTGARDTGDAAPARERATPEEEPTLDKKAVSEDTSLTTTP